jgi:hypothetical protein
MRRRPFLTTLISTLVLLPFVRSVQGAEAASGALDPRMATGLHRDGGLDDMARQRLSTRLAQAGFVMTGDGRRKGQFVILEARRDGVSWRLVLDGSTGEIVGRRPLGQLISLQN